MLIDQRYLLFLREWEQRHAELEGEDRFAHEADLAFAGQTLIEEAVLHIVRWGAEHTKLRKLCLAGGVALNAVANGRIVAETPIEEVYVQPGANDAGVAIGAAYFTYYKMSGKPREFVMDHCYLGKTYGEAEIDAALARFRGQPRLEQPADVVERTADLLAEGKIVGWYQGGSEFGPRALGNRSILADPRSKETWGRVNEIKSREWFRPLAPSVLAEHQSEYFDFDAPSPYMLMIAHVQPGEARAAGRDHARRRHVAPADRRPADEPALPPADQRVPRAHGRADAAEHVVQHPGADRRDAQGRGGHVPALRARRARDRRPHPDAACRDRAAEPSGAR